MFVNTAAEVYWTSTSTAGSSSAGRVSFYNGDDLGYSKDLVQNVRCVRGSLTPASKQLTRDYAAEVVTDSGTNLVWQDNVIAWATGQSAAIYYCENLSLDGHSDWRVPNLNELRSINDSAYSNPAVYPVFQNTKGLSYWTSTSFAINRSLAWTVNFNAAGFGFDDKSGSIKQ